MAKYKFVDITYSEKEKTSTVNDNIENILEEQSMYGFRLAHVVNIEYGMFGPTRAKLIFEKEK